MRKFLIVWVPLFLFVHSLRCFAADGYLYFRGFPNKEVLLFRLSTDHNGAQKRTPLLKLKTNSKVLLPAGKYLLANECTSYEFSHGQSQTDPTVIYLSHVQIKLAGRVPTKDELLDKNQVISAVCFNIFENKKTLIQNQGEFDILPGKNKLSVSGKSFPFDLKPSEFKDFNLDLSSVSLRSDFEKGSHPFFVTPVLEEASAIKKSSSDEPILSAPVNGKIWLYPGKYQFEVNGTLREMELKNSEEQSVSLGSLRISAPHDFPFEKRLESGVQPIFVSIKSDVLYQLDTEYVVFPGDYTLSLNNSKIEKKITVLEGQEDVVRTYGAQVDPPECPPHVLGCRQPPNITVHVDKETFDAMVIPAGVPFLVFDGNYQYGVEGVRGILKNLVTSADSVAIQKIAHVKLNWHKIPASGKQRTNFVRFESSGAGLSGKSLDLLFSKPNDLYLPEGVYSLTYYTSDLSAPSSPKVRQEVSLLDKETQEITIPLYIQGVVSEPKEVETPKADDKPILKAIK